METKFQTSFIPRKPITSSLGATTPAPHRSIGSGNLFMTLSAALFVISLLSIGGAFFYKQYLVKAQAGYVSQLKDMETKYDINTIRLLKAESTKIQLAKGLLSNHIASSKLFAVLGGLTVENVRFLQMSFTTPASGQGGSDYKINLMGYGRDLPTLAFQAQVLNKLTDFGLQNIIRNPIVSDPAFNLNGSISFNLTASIDQSALLYQVAAPAAAPTSGQTQ